MKKSLTKLIVSCAAVAAVTTAMAVSASAASYDAEAKTVTTGITSAAAVDKQATILVYKADSADTEATAESILYIDQQAMTADGLWKTLSLDLADGKYVIKMGGEGAEVASEVLTVGEVVVGNVGDVDESGEIDTLDALAVVNHFLEKNIIEDAATIARADVDGSEEIDTLDALEIVNYFLEKPNLITGDK